MNGMLGQAARALQGAILAAKGRCYQRVFDLDGVNADQVSRVLGDLRRYCRADQSTFDADTHHAARLAGRREVWLRLQGFLNLSDAQVHRLVEVESDYVD